VFRASHRSRRHTRRRPDLTIDQILEWADRHYQRTGQWPCSTDGPVTDAPAEKWCNLTQALRHGRRGLPGGLSLPQLLAERRGVRNRGALPPLTVEEILSWADAYRDRHQVWPHTDAGPVAEAPGEAWDKIDQALRDGGRGLPGNSSLALLLVAQRGARIHLHEPPLDEERILAWAQAHRERTGRWPVAGSGDVPEEPGETWHAINDALRGGRRGLSAGDSLATLLARRLGARNNTSVPRLTVPRIVAWADQHYARTGQWPTATSGPVVGAPGETWLGIDQALRGGQRGLRLVSSLARLLARQRNVRNRAALAPLTLHQILVWADAHYRRTSAWPGQRSGPVAEAFGETWMGIQTALFKGTRGLPGGDSLHQLLVRTGRKPAEGGELPVPEADAAAGT
jgi:hypothetical protein